MPAHQNFALHSIRVVNVIKIEKIATKFKQPLQCKNVKDRLSSQFVRFWAAVETWRYNMTDSGEEDLLPM